jgi:hypothetical protein
MVIIGIMNRMMTAANHHLVDVRSPAAAKLHHLLALLDERYQKQIEEHAEQQ